MSLVRRVIFCVHRYLICLDWYCIIHFEYENAGHLASLVTLSFNVQYRKDNQAILAFDKATIYVKVSQIIKGVDFSKAIQGYLLDLLLMLMVPRPELEFSIPIVIPLFLSY